MKMKQITIIAALFISSITFSQASNLGKFFAGGAEDAEKLFEGYLSPYFNAFGTSLTGGWYNTAKPHSLGGFDVTVTFNTAIVPSSDQTFDLSTLGLETLIASDGEELTPTVAGKNETGSLMYYNIPEVGTEDIKAFDMPKGTGFPYIPSPMLQLGIGLIKDTEVIGRFMPTYSSGDAKIGMWGVGVIHGLKQWIPFIKRVPVLNLSLQYGFTKLNSEIGLNVNPGDIEAVDYTSNAWNNQSLEFVTKSHTGNLLISADLPIVCFYGGVGFASTKTNLMLVGDFPSIDVERSALEGHASVTDESTLPDPINSEFSNSDGSITKPRYNAGMRFKFAVVTLQFDYTYATYSMVTAGLGISFR
jgi:hypothetical protein